ncbi:MAG: type II toxin-antitoxin system ParD family antitoxin [Micropepsaceae bacterium]
MPRPIPKKLSKLRAALAEGEVSGDPRPFDRKAFVRRMKAKQRTKRQKLQS